MNPSNELLDMIHAARAKIAEISARLDRMEARQAVIDGKDVQPSNPPKP
jgi:BMFP domain-containing protein YqiC